MTVWKLFNRPVDYSHLDRPKNCLYLIKTLWSAGKSSQRPVEQRWYSTRRKSAGVSQEDENYERHYIGRIVIREGHRSGDEGGLWSVRSQRDPRRAFVAGGEAAELTEATGRVADGCRARRVRERSP